MIQCLLEHLGDGLLGFEKLHAMDGVGEVRMELQQEFAFCGGKGTLLCGSIEADVSDEVLVWRPEQEGTKVAHPIGGHDLAIEVRGE